MSNCFFVSYGIQYEPMAKEEFEIKYNLKVLPAGLFVDASIIFWRVLQMD